MRVVASHADGTIAGEANARFQDGRTVLVTIRLDGDLGDAGMDAEIDAATDAGRDAATDTRRDSDLNPDAGTDAMDADADTGRDVGTCDEREGLACELPGRCGDGVFVCATDGLICDSISRARDEECNEVDDDCDGDTDEDFDVGASCDTLCGEGVFVCSDAGLMACRTVPIDDELCNGRDEDCDGRVDEDACDGCEAVRFGGSTARYLYCSFPRRTWSQAQVWCRERGYDLVTLNNADEDDDLARGVDDDTEWWMGVSTDGDDYTWSSGAPFMYGSVLRSPPWARDEPDSDGAQCILRTRDGWADYSCGISRGFICELTRP